MTLNLDDLSNTQAIHYLILATRNTEREIPTSRNVG